MAGISLIIGLSLGAVPLWSQAFGAGTHPRTGHVLQRQLAMQVLLVAAIVLPLWLGCEPLLSHLGQPARVAALTARFVAWRLPALPFVVAHTTLTAFCQAQLVVRGPMVVSCAANALLFALFPLLILRSPLGYDGAAIALTVKDALHGVAMVLLTPRWLRSAGVRSWPHWWRDRREAARGWRELLRLAAPSSFGTGEA